MNLKFFNFFKYLVMFSISTLYKTFLSFLSEFICCLSKIKELFLFKTSSICFNFSKFLTSLNSSIPSFLQVGKYPKIVLFSLFILFINLISSSVLYKLFLILFFELNIIFLGQFIFSFRKSIINVFRQKFVCINKIFIKIIIYKFCYWFS